LSNLKTVKAGGSRLVDVICDDAQGCEGTCRITAMLLLDAITNLACKEKSTYMVDMYSRSNFIDVLVESINEMSDELRNAKSEDVDLLLAYYESKLSLVLTVSQSRVGATVVTNSGLYSAVRRSGLFSADLDLGLGK